MLELSCLKFESPDMSVLINTCCLAASIKIWHVYALQFCYEKQIYFKILIIKQAKVWNTNETGAAGITESQKALGNTKTNPGENSFGFAFSNWTKAHF